jgi:hypothetical protein
VVKGAITVPPWRGSDVNRAQQIATTVGAVQDVLAPYDVQVVTTRPVNPGYDLIVMGGDPLLVIGGASIDPGVGPIDCASAPGNVGFVYDDTPPGNVAAAAVIVIYAVMHGLPTTAQQGDCLCYVNEVCTPSISLCELGRDVPLADDYCSLSTAPVDDQQEFADAFGCRP